MSDTVSVRKGDLDILVAAVATWAPGDMTTEAREAFGRLMNAFDEAHASDTPASEPAKVIVVVDETGTEHRYTASEAGSTAEGCFVVGEPKAGGRPGELNPTAVFAPGRWTRAYDATAPAGAGEASDHDGGEQ